MILESLNQIKDNKNVKSIHIIKLKKGNNIIIGRGKEADVLIEDISVSRKHASICLTDENELRLEDRGSKFGTLVLIPNEYSCSAIKTSLQIGKTLLEVESEFSKPKIKDSEEEYNTQYDSNFINNDNNNNNNKINNSYEKSQINNKKENFLDLSENLEEKVKESKSTVKDSNLNQIEQSKEILKPHTDKMQNELNEKNQIESKNIEKEKDDLNRNLNNMHFFAEEEELQNNNCYDSRDYENKKSRD